MSKKDLQLRKLFDKALRSKDRGHMASAQRRLETIVERAPQLAEPRLELAWIHLREERYEAALKAAREGLLEIVDSRLTASFAAGVGVKQGQSVDVDQGD